MAGLLSRRGRAGVGAGVGTGVVEVEVEVKGVLIGVFDKDDDGGEDEGSVVAIALMT